MITQIEYEPHELAKIFPAMKPEELHELALDIEKNGQLDCIIRYEGKILDGVHRDKACKMAGKTPRYGDWEQLPPVVRERGPLAFVIGRNLKRRHLTTSQRSMIATELIPAYEKAIKDRESARKKGLGQKNLSPPENNGEQGLGQKKLSPPENGEAMRGTAAGQAAKAVGVSESSVKAAKRIKAKSPEKAEKIKAGKLTVGKATRDEAKIQAAKQRWEAAIARIKKVCGKTLADAVEKGILLKSHKDLLAFADQSDAEMKAQQGLIEIGWKLKNAQHYKTKNLTLKHTLADFAHEAATSGFRLTVDIEGWHFVVTRTKEVTH